MTELEKQQKINSYCKERLITPFPNEISEDRSFIEKVNKIKEKCGYNETEKGLNEKNIYVVPYLNPVYSRYHYNTSELMAMFFYFDNNKKNVYKVKTIYLGSTSENEENANFFERLNNHISKNYKDIISFEKKFTTVIECGYNF